MGHDRGADLVPTQEVSFMPDIRNEIMRWTREGASLKLIGRRISRLRASDEGKAALWLWAWSCRRPGESHRTVLGD
jgi:hypothetical protein